MTTSSSSSSSMELQLNHAAFRACAPLTTTTTLQALPENCLQHILFLLGDLDDLVNFACTASSSRAFLHAHWRWVRPDGADYRQKFVDRMDMWRAIAVSSFRRRRETLLDPAPPMDPTTRTTWAMPLGSRSTLFFFQHFPLPPRVNDGTLFAQSLRVSSEWIDDPDGMLIVECSGQVIIRMDSDVARMEGYGNGGGDMDLMRYLRHLPLDLVYANLKLNNLSGAKIVVTITYVAAAAAAQQQQQQEEEEPGLIVYPAAVSAAQYDLQKGWVIDVMSWPVPFVVGAASEVATVRVPNHFLSVEYITLRSSETCLPPIEQFTLIVDWTVGRQLMPSGWSIPTELVRGTWRNQIPGWPCRIADSSGGCRYRLPIQRLCFVRFAKVQLEIKFASPPRPKATTMFLSVRAQNIVLQGGGMMGLAFSP